MLGKDLIEFIQSNTLENAEFFGMIPGDETVGYEFETGESPDLIFFLMENAVIVKMIPIPIEFE